MEHRFFSIMSVLTLIVVLLGFGNTYGARLLTSQEPISPLIHIHGMIFAVWVFLFVGQSLLVIKGQMKWHYRLGKMGIVLAGLMLFSAFFTALEAARQGHLGIPGVEFPTVGGFLFLNLASACIFTILAFAGWLLREKPHLHKRLMLMATVAGLAPPGISRLPLFSGHTPAIAAFTMLFIFAGPIYDWRTLGKPSKAYLFSLPLVVFILPPVVTAITGAAWWQEFTTYLIAMNF